MILRLTFKAHGEVTTRNVKADDGLDQKTAWKYAMSITKQRWPSLVGKLQKLERK